MMKIWWALAALMITTPLSAAPGDWVDGVQPIATPAQPGVIALPVSLPRAHPTSEAWAQQGGDQRLAYNVAAPQLVPMPSSLPADQVAPAVLLVPGGGFQFLSMDNEGYAVARRLDRLGVRVFIVKYRTHPIAGGFDGFKAALTGIFVNDEPVDDSDVPFAVADTQAAIRMVRARAGEWHVDPAKVGILGFSAGAMTVLGTTQANAADARPDFVGMIYGPTAGGNVPPNAPPLFAALAADDRFFGAQDLSLIHAWRQAGSPVELHLYSGGGHGFASYPNGTTSDAWFDQWALWLRATGIVGAAG
jgi:acetyl esterase/lipase